MSCSAETCERCTVAPGVGNVQPNDVRRVVHVNVAVPAGLLRRSGDWLLRLVAGGAGVGRVLGESPGVIALQR
jgi:hypothetical protein